MYSVKTYKKGIFCIIMSMILMMSSVSAFPVENLISEMAGIEFYTYGDHTKKETMIKSTKIAGIDTIVFPSSATKENIVLYCNYDKPLFVAGSIGKEVFISGKALNVSNLCNENDCMLTFIDLNDSDVIMHKLRLCFTKNLPAIYLSSSDPVNMGREWVEISEDKSNKATGTMLMQKPSGEVVHSGALTQIKGRGNTTWGLVKKPYQIKLESKADLLETGDDGNKSKTWILLANYLDPAGIRNTLALDLGRALNMPSNIQGKSVDLFYDGEYRGMYMLTEKVEVGSGRVDVTDLEDENGKANAGIDLEQLPIFNGTTANGATYKYCAGMKSPADITGGYLLEMDYEDRALEEICYFRTKRGMYVVVKSPEFASKEEMDYIATLYQEYEDAVFAGGVNPVTGKKYSDYVDARSTACYYLVNELSKARDCFKSSAYLHKKAGEDKLYMGPLWDYDMSFGKGGYGEYYQHDVPHGMIAYYSVMSDALLRLDDFYAITKNIYQNEIVPLVNNVMLGDINATSENGALKSLDYYFNLVNDSAIYNKNVWYENEDWEAEKASLYEFLNGRQRELSIYFEKYPHTYYVPEMYFSDISLEDWFYDSVIEVSKKGILNGVGDGYFVPSGNVTRAHAIQVVYNMSGVGDVKYIPIFKDVSPDAWYAKAAVWSGINRFFDRREDGVFNPDEVITREEFIDILHRHAGRPKVNSNLLDGYIDAQLVTKRDAVEWALNSGLIQGSDMQINPLGNMTRAELAVILDKFTK